MPSPAEVPSIDGWIFPLFGGRLLSAYRLEYFFGPGPVGGRVFGTVAAVSVPGLRARLEWHRHRRVACRRCGPIANVDTARSPRRHSARSRGITGRHRRPQRQVPASAVLQRHVDHVRAAGMDPDGRRREVGHGAAVERRGCHRPPGRCLARRLKHGCLSPAPQQRYARDRTDRRLPTNSRWHEPWPATHRRAAWRFRSFTTIDFRTPWRSCGS